MGRLESFGILVTEVLILRFEFFPLRLGLGLGVGIDIDKALAILIEDKPIAFPLDIVKITKGLAIP